MIFTPKYLITQINSPLSWAYYSQIIIGITGILVLPFYLKLFDLQTYGLIATFAAIQTFIGLLDLGITSTIIRQINHFRAKSIDLRTITVIYSFFVNTVLILAILSFALIFTFLLISNKYNFMFLDQQQYAQMMLFISVAICLRWVSLIDRAILQSYSAIRLLSIINIIVVMTRHLGCIYVLYLLEPSIEKFIVYNVCISIFELLIVHINTLKVKEFSWIKILRYDDIKSIVAPRLYFMLSSGLISVLWIISSNIDKFITSMVLNLEQFGKLNVVLTASAVIIFLSVPISRIKLPELNLRYSQNLNHVTDKLLIKDTLDYALLLFPIGFVGIIFSHELFIFWISDSEITADIAKIFVGYCVYNMLVILNIPIYQTLHSLEKLKRLVKFNVFTLVLSIVILCIALKFFSYSVTPVALIMVQIIYMAVLLPIIFKKDLGLSYWNWLKNVIFKPIGYYSPIVCMGYMILLNLEILMAKLMLAICMTFILLLMKPQIIRG